MEEHEQIYGIYISINENNDVARMFSSYYTQPADNDILIKQGTGAEFKKQNYPVKTYYGLYRYTWDGSELIEKDNLSEIEAILDEKKKKNRLAEIEKRMTQLSQDFMQKSLGAIIDFEAKRAEFILLQNEARELMGKEARQYV